MTRDAPRRAGALAALVSLVGLVGLVSACRALDPFEHLPEESLPRTGAVVSQHPLATAVGLGILRAGGNAADAAVATALALAVVYPQAGNLGGGGFALWVPHAGEPASLDFRETAPAGYEARLYLDEAGEVVRERSLSTPLAVGVPGSPAGLFELYRRFGSKRLSFVQLCDPAIRLARSGFHVDPWLAQVLASESTRRHLTADPAAAGLFYPGGKPLAEGEILKQPALAATLRRFARGGVHAFYHGDTARSIVASLEAADVRAGGVTRGGGMTLADLAAYEVREREPVIGWFRGMEIIGMGPPSSGGVALLQVLAILDGFPLGAERTRTQDELETGAPIPAEVSGLSARAVHWWIEAMRLAFADRAEHLGDPDQHPVPLTALLDSGWIAERRMSIRELSDPDVGPMGLQIPPEGSQTTHLSVLDEDGNAVSLTTTLNGSFGSGIMAAEAGFFLNNELDDFSIRAGTANMYGLVGGAANQLMPGKRPLSSMTPTVVRDGGRRVSLVIGAPGGPRIITAVIQVILRMLVYEQDLQTAVAAPRLHQQWSPQVTRFEPGWNPDLLQALRSLHDQEVETAGGGYGSVQAISVAPDGTVVGVSDPRHGGSAGIQGEPLPPPRRPDMARR